MEGLSERMDDLKTRMKKLPYFTVHERDKYMEERCVQNKKSLRHYRMYMEEMYVSNLTRAQIEHNIQRQYKALKADTAYDIGLCDAMLDNFISEITNEEFKALFKITTEIEVDPDLLKRAGMSLLEGASVILYGKEYTKRENTLVLSSGNKK
jgi:hypothetical protein